MSFLNNKFITIYRDVDYEAFYDIDIRHRHHIIISHLLLYVLPIIVTVFYFLEQFGTTLFYLMVGLSVLLYVTAIAETVSYMYPKSRRLFKKYFWYWMAPVFIAAAFAGYHISKIIIEVESGSNLMEIDFSYIGIGFVIMLGCYILIQVGLSFVFKASRAIYSQKASMEADVRFATEIQERILKSIVLEETPIQGYACSLPANELGGDFFELMRHEEQIIAAVGDISGHSFGAGLLMTMTKSALQTHLRYVQSPAKVLSELNSLLLHQTDRAMYATMSMLSIDIGKKTAVVSNAGHHPVLHFDKKTQSLEKWMPKGMGLGMTGKANYENLEIPFSDGDVLVLYTDGLVETRDENNIIREASFFEDLVLRILRDESGSPKDIADTIIQEVLNTHHGEDMEDDASLIVLKKG